MSTTLDASFLRAVVMMTGFKPNRMRRAQAALLMLGFSGQDYSAADLPDEVTEGSRHLAGAATGSLISIGLLTVIRREKSPEKKAKGRKLDILQLTSIEKAKAWLRANQFEIPTNRQPELL